MLDDKQILNDELKAIIAEELNVKEVFSHNRTEAPGVVLNLEISPQLRREGMMREVIRHVQNSRKDAGLQVDDRINLSFRASGPLLEAVNTYEQAIKDETLAVELSYDAEYEYVARVNVEDQELVISLKKA